MPGRRRYSLTAYQRMSSAGLPSGEQQTEQEVRNAVTHNATMFSHDLFKQTLKDLSAVTTYRLSTEVGVTCALAGVISWYSKDHVAEGLEHNLYQAIVSAIGMLLAFLISFRSQRAYDRWWEGRNLWGRQVYASRHLMQQASAWVPDVGLRARMKAAIDSFAMSSKQVLREGEEEPELNLRNLQAELVEILGREEAAFVLAMKSPRAYYFLEVLRACARENFSLQVADSTNIAAAAAMEDAIKTLSRCLGGSMRVKNSPVPYSHVAQMRIATFAYCLATAAACAPVVGMYAILVVLCFGWLALGAQDVADRLEQPFGLFPDDLDLEGFCRSIKGATQEVYLRSMDKRDLTQPWGSPLRLPISLPTSEASPPSRPSERMEPWMERSA